MLTRTLTRTALALLFLAATPHVAEAKKKCRGIKICKVPSIRIVAPKPPRLPTPKDIGNALSGAGKEIGKAAENTGRTARIAARDATRVASTAVRQTWAATLVAEKQLIEAHTAYYQFYGDLIAGTAHSLSDAERRLREGKLADALFQVAWDQVRIRNDAAFAATERSVLIDVGAEFFVGAQFGPEGAAAFAAWKTYNETDGDVTQAMANGLWAGSMSAVMGKATDALAPSAFGALPLASRRAAAGGALAGIVAASQGEHGEALLRAMLRGGAEVVVEEQLELGQHGDVPHEKTASTSSGGAQPTVTSANAYCMAGARDGCSAERATLPSLTAASGGTRASAPTKRTRVTADSLRASSPLLQALALDPSLNVVSLFDDQWLLVWRKDAFADTLHTPVIRLMANGASVPTPHEAKAFDPTAPVPTIHLEPSPDSTIAQSDARGVSRFAPLPGMRWARPSDTLSLAVVVPPGLVQVKFGQWQPAPGWRWRNTRGTTLDVEPIPGVVAVGTDRVQPLPGWEWVSAGSASDLRVRLQRGLEEAEDGSLMPADGYRWANPENPDDVRVVATHQ